MTFRDWQQLSPAQAAQELHQRVHSRLSPAQQRAAITHLRSEAELAQDFAAAPRGLPLSGVPYFLKDIFPVAGQPMFAGSTFLPEVRPLPTQDSVIVQHLRAAGAVLAGRTHLQEFAYGITGENSHYGDCAHPHYPSRLSGGSSSGSAAVVAAGIVPLAIGTDTGGSIRVPAAFCGLFGFRLTPGDPFISDAFPLAPSYDTAGWFTANAGDMATTIASLIGLPTAQQVPRGCYSVLRGLDADVSLACVNEVARAAGPDCETPPVTFAELETYNTVVAEEAWKIHQPWAKRFQDRYDPSVWQRLNRVHQLTEKQREEARKCTQTIKRGWGEYFRSHDFFALAASPFAALTKADCTLENRNRILSLTAPASIGGYPVLTIPVALPSGLTTGLQIIVPEVRSPALGWALKTFTFLGGATR